MHEYIEAKCECGFDHWPFNDMGAFFDGRSTPAVCRKCNQFFHFNYLEGQKYCSYCGKEVEFYMLEHILDVQSSEPDGELLEFDMTKKYYCPGCGYECAETR